MDTQPYPFRNIRTQGVGSVVSEANKRNLAELYKELNRIKFQSAAEKRIVEERLEDALDCIDRIYDFVGSPENILGSQATKHGEIAEHVDVEFHNAWNAIRGKAHNATFENVGRTAPEDYLVGGVAVQSKYIAKLQEIVIHILIMLSQENAELSTAVKQQAELLIGLSCNNMVLLNAIKKIKFGGTAQIDFSDLSRERKVLIASLLIMADATEQQNESSRRYFGSILTLANTSAFDNTVRPNAVDSLNREEQELLYRMVMIGRYLLGVPFEKDSEVLDWVSIHQNRKNEIQQSILDTAAVVTQDFFISYYEKTAESFDSLSDEGILLGIAEETTAANENKSTDHPQEEPVEEQPSQEQNDERKLPRDKKNTELSEMVKSAETAVNVAVATATTTCAVPIPFADAPILIC